MTAGFAGSALAMFYVLRRWAVSMPAAVLGGAVYGFSPAMLHSAIGHYDLQFAVLPPLMIHMVLCLATGRAGSVRGGLWLGLPVTAQLFITEEILAATAIAAFLLAAVLAASRPRERRPRPGGWRPACWAVAAGVTLVIAGDPLWVQFFGPLRQHGSPFQLDYFKNDLSSFVVPSSYQLIHTASSAAAAARYQGQLPEYLGYLGWPLLVLLVLAASPAGGGCRPGRPRSPAWCWGFSRSAAPCCSAATTTRRSSCPGTGCRACRAGIGAARPVFPGRRRRGRRAAGLRRGRGRPGLRRVRRRRCRAGGGGGGGGGLGLPRLSAGWRPAAVVMAAAVLAALPIVPKPLPVAAATPVPAGWSEAFAALRLPPSASVLVVPVPMSTFTEPLRWQADTGEPRSMVGGYFMGPGPHGRGYIDGNGTPPAGVYLNAIWVFSQAGLRGASAAGASAAGARAAGRRAAGASATGNLPVKSVTNTKMREQIKAWKVSAVVAVATPGSRLGRYLTAILGSPVVVTGDVMAWRFPASLRHSDAIHRKVTDS